MLTQQLLNGIITGSLYGIAALGLGLVYGIFHVPNMAHGPLFMFGAFATLVGCSSGNYFFGLFVGAVTIAIIMMLSDLLVYKPLRKKNNDAMSMMIASIGIEVMLLNIALKIWSANPRSIPIAWDGKMVDFFGITITYHRVLVFFASVIIVAIVAFIVQKTRYGKAMRACAQDMEAAKITGINTNKVAMLTFALSGIMIGLAGGLVGPMTMVYPSMGNIIGTKCFAVVILGGATSIPGVMIGGLLLGIAEALTAQYVSSMYIDVTAFLILIVVLLVKPSGLFGKKRIVKV